MSFTSLYFMFDNVKSTDMDLYIVNLESGMYGTPTGGDKSFTSEKVPYKDSLYIYKTELTNMKFQIVLSPLETLWTDDYKYKILKWLGTREPKEFKTCDNINKLCYCICTNAMEVFTAGLQQGYIILQFEATTPYWLSTVEINTFDLSTIASPTEIVLANKSNVMDSKLNKFYYYPENLSIDLKGLSTSITLINLSDGGRVFQFTGLNTEESLIINNQLKEIESSTGLYRLNNFNKNWFRLLYGTNRIKVNEPCVIQIKMQFPIYM